jgi:hypothetical protein
MAAASEALEIIAGDHAVVIDVNGIGIRGARVDVADGPVAVKLRTGPTVSGVAIADGYPV